MKSSLRKKYLQRNYLIQKKNGIMSINIDEFFNTIDKLMNLYFKTNF